MSSLTTSARPTGPPTQLRRHASWDEPATLPDEDDVAGYLRAGPSTTFTVEETGDFATVDTAVQHDLARPTAGRSSRTPRSRRAAGWPVWDGDDLHVWSLEPEHLRSARRSRRRRWHHDVDRIEVEHVESAGAYGHNGADDAAFDAVLLARAVPGRPVQVRWSRPTS